MDNFNKIIQEKAANFDVPFNEAHWAEMEERLNLESSNRKKNLLLGFAATTIILAGLSTITFFSNTKSESDNIKSISTETNKEQKNTTVKETISPLPNTVVNLSIPKEPTSTTNITTSSVSNNPKQLTTTTKTKNSQKRVVNVSTTKQISKIDIQRKVSQEPTKLVKEKTINLNNPVVSAKAKENSPAPTVKATHEINTAGNIDRIKDIRQISLEEEKEIKKGLKRRRWSWFSFKKKRYKVPVSRIKSKRKK